jgi:hypothetical protein
MQFTSFPFISLLLAPVLITARLSVTNIRGNHQQQLDERILVPKTSSVKAPAPKWKPAPKFSLHCLFNTRF